jgi:endonuclease G
MRADRRLPLYTAVNIDGGKLFSFPRSRDVWWHDGRLDLDVQASEALYVGNPLDRGHLVRRLDPAWGDTREEAKLGEEDTFHFTNCAPQHEGMNQRTWLSLEDYILGNANILNFKASIFTGPVFGDADKSYRGLQLPQEFWKVAVMVNQATGMLSATGYLLSQADLIKGLEFVYGQYRTYQVPISMIELKTGLRFELGMYDPLDSTEGTPVREVLVPQDMVL